MVYHNKIQMFCSKALTTGKNLKKKKHLPLISCDRALILGLFPLPSLTYVVLPNRRRKNTQTTAQKGQLTHRDQTAAAAAAAVGGSKRFWHGRATVKCPSLQYAKNDMRVKKKNTHTIIIVREKVYGKFTLNEPRKSIQLVVVASVTYLYGNCNVWSLLFCASFVALITFAATDVIITPLPHGNLGGGRVGGWVDRGRFGRRNP
ncbi:hypothetical protein AGLY_012683 [Aphis glycines]|uniref:Uncharacterized protein n=1 Tax=Aphis glycines TaxID=307491 RepID=A0A6G0T8M5_APHGL|nr:hypothetical protein AGLY_012683 [Aphis glycines]